VWRGACKGEDGKGKKALPGSFLVKKGDVVGLHKGLKSAPHVVGTRVAPPRRLAVEIAYNKHMTHMTPMWEQEITIILDPEPVSLQQRSFI
jgi:hypothetical protein